MRILATAAIGFGLFGGAAQADIITEACAAVMEDSLRTPVVPRNAQSFPELNPPRVSLQIATAEDREVLPVVVRCSFTQPNSPIGLREICIETRCFHENSVGEAQVRFEEMRALLKRRGY